MIEISDSVFVGPTVRLTAIDREKDAPIEAGWSQDLDYAFALRRAPVRPLLATEVRKLYAETEEEMDKGRRLHFAVRSRSDDRLLGFTRFRHIHWTFSEGVLDIAIGDPQAAGQVESEVLRLMLDYAFGQTNLFRVRLMVPETNCTLISALKANGLTLEVRSREAIFRGGQYWDILHYGLLASEWKQLKDKVNA